LVFSPILLVTTISLLIISSSQRIARSAALLLDLAIQQEQIVIYSLYLDLETDGHHLNPGVARLKWDGVARIVNEANQIGTLRPDPSALEGLAIAEDYGPALSPYLNLDGIVDTRSGAVLDDVRIQVIGVDRHHVSGGDLLTGQLVPMGLP
jgi:hypothetical protein